MKRLVIPAILACLILMLCGCGGGSSDSNDSKILTMIVNEDGLQINDTVMKRPIEVSDFQTILGKWDRELVDSARRLYTLDSHGFAISKESDTEGLFDLSFDFYIENKGGVMPKNEFSGSIFIDGLIVDEYTTPNDFEKAGFLKSFGVPWQKEFGDWNVRASFTVEDKLRGISLQPLALGIEW